MAAVAAGRFRTPARVEQPETGATSGASGRVNLNDDSNWCEFWRGRVEVLAITARERVYADQPVADITHRITLRKSEQTAGITHRMRVRIGSRKLNIASVIEVGSPARLIELSCVEQV